MTGERLVELMQNKRMKQVVYKAARRYTKCPEDIEEYMDDAWMRIADCNDDKTDEYYERQARLAIKASYYRKRYAGSVQKTERRNLYGISESPKCKRIPRNALPLGHGRYLHYKPEKLSKWYYDGEWRDYGLDKNNVQVMAFYEIVALST